MVDNKRKRRKAPYPNSILDRKALTQALDDAGLSVKATHIDTVYQALHRQHYPSLPDLVETYYRFEREARETKDTRVPNKETTDEVPLKNCMGKKKNKNKKQIPRALLEYLRTTTDFVTITSSVADARRSADGSTTKLAVKLHDGQLVESVLMRYINKDGSRASLCVSSQCGCAMGCTFCATGTMGLSGNLTTGEMLEQIVHADRILANEWAEHKENGVNLDFVRNVVFMGMGEPLDNYSNVVEACRALIDKKRWNLAHGKVTVSTVGLVSQMRKLTAELPEICLALSLHAPNQKMREAIVPTASRYPIEQLIDALDGHMLAYLHKRFPNKPAFSAEERIQESSRRRAMIEYVMLEGDTSSIEAAHQLGQLCEKRHLVVNLIPYNATDVRDKLRCPSNEKLTEFRNIVASYGAFCTIRKTMGADIASACGQLITNEESQNGKVADIEDTLKKEEDIATERDISVIDRDSNRSQTPHHLDKTVRILSWATAAAGTSFAISALLFFRKLRR